MIIHDDKYNYEVVKVVPTGYEIWNAKPIGHFLPLAKPINNTYIVDTTCLKAIYLDDLEDVKKVHRAVIWGRNTSKSCQTYIRKYKGRVLNSNKGVLRKIQICEEALPVLEKLGL